MNKKIEYDNAYALRQLFKEHREREARRMANFIPTEITPEQEEKNRKGLAKILDNHIRNSQEDINMDKKFNNLIKKVNKKQQRDSVKEEPYATKEQLALIKLLREKQK